MELRTSSSDEPRKSFPESSGFDVCDNLFHSATNCAEGLQAVAAVDEPGVVDGLGVGLVLVDDGFETDAIQQGEPVFTNLH